MSTTPRAEKMPSAFQADAGQRNAFQIDTRVGERRGATSETFNPEGGD